MSGTWLHAWDRRIPDWIWLEILPELSFSHRVFFLFCQGLIGFVQHALATSQLSYLIHLGPPLRARCGAISLSGTDRPGEFSV